MQIVVAKKEEIKSYPQFCEACHKDCEFFYIKSRFNGNIDNRELCEECYTEIHNEVAE